MTTRRTFLGAAGATFRGLPFAQRTSLGQSAASSATVYDGRFVPDGADCKVAFVSDHHYWPGHLENWGGGGQITTSTERRMPDLAAVLNEEQPGLSLHGGDVISAGGSFFPPPEEYARQLSFAQEFYKRLSHPFVPMLGNHETLESAYNNEEQLEAWKRHFGPLHRYHDLKGWRFVAVNCLLPNPKSRYGRGDNYGNVFGLDAAQMEWLGRTLQEASSRRLNVVICTHVPPRGWVNAAEFEKLIAAPGSVRAILCGHTHRNSIDFMGGVPVLIRVANVTSPFGYTMVHCYPDGRVLLVQKSQHFPFEDFISSSIQRTTPLGSESDRYITVGGSSQLPLENLNVVGNEARALIHDGHLRLSGRNDRALVVINTAPLQQARLTLTAVKASGERIGGIALAGPDGKGGIEAAVTSRYSPDGKVYLAATSGDRRDILARSWFNIADNIAYHLTLEITERRIIATWKNMLKLEVKRETAAAGHFGFFVDNGVMFVTDLRLERLG
jgi:hypothetical protein